MHAIGGFVGREDRPASWRVLCLRTFTLRKEAESSHRLTSPCAPNKKGRAVEAANVHALIWEPIGFQAAPGTAVDEQRKLRITSAAIWEAEAPRLSGSRTSGFFFQSLSGATMRKLLITVRASTVLDYDSTSVVVVFDSVSPRTVKELSRRMANFCNRSAILAKVVGGVTPLGFVIASCVCSSNFGESRHGFGKASNGEGFFWATASRGVVRCVWKQAARSEWATADGYVVATIFYDLGLIDAAARTRFPLRQLRLLAH